MESISYSIQRSCRARLGLCGGNFLDCTNPCLSMGINKTGTIIYIVAFFMLATALNWILESPHQPRNVSIKADLGLVGARTTFLCANLHVKRLSPFRK